MAVPDPMILQGDARHIPLADSSVNCVVTSPPYWGLRDYGSEGQLGLEPTPDEYVAATVGVFREVWRVLKTSGTLWLNLGDSYAGAGGTASGVGHNAKVGATKSGTQTRAASDGRSRRPPAGYKAKSLVGIPWRVALALQADGWILRSDIIWAKPNPMPESVTDRPTKSHEHLFLLAKSQRYYFDQDAVREPHKHPELASKDIRAPNAGRKGDYQRESGRNDGGTHISGPGFKSDPVAGRNIRDVWTIATQPFPGAHFAVMPPALVEPCIKAGCPEGGFVLDPFMGAGTVGLVADRLQRRWIGLELSPKFAAMARDRIRDDCPLFAGVAP